MKVLLRLRGLDRKQHQNMLLATDEAGLLYPSVEYKGSTHDKDGHNLDLKIETERDLFARGSDKIPVLRDVVDKLWDVLDIFPRGSGGVCLSEDEKTIADSILIDLANSQANDRDLRITLCKRLEKLLRIQAQS